MEARFPARFTVESMHSKVTDDILEGIQQLHAPLIGQQTTAAKTPRAAILTRSAVGER